MSRTPRKPRAIKHNSDTNAGHGSDGLTISRRAFLGITAGAAAVVGAAYATRWPKFTFPSKPAEYTEGVGEERWVPTSCLNCPTRCAVNVRKVQIRNEDTWHAVRIVGNPKSTYSDGKTCPRSHVGLQVLYNPERIETKPLRRKPGVPKGIEPGPEALASLKDSFEEIEWEEALTHIAGELRKLTNPGKLLILQGLNTTCDEDLINRFAKAYGTVNLLTEDALELDADTTGKVMAVGRKDSGYDLEKCNYVLAFSANIVESERPLARNLRAWGKIRRGRPDRARVVVADPRYSVTAAKADEWIPINPGTEGALAMAIAHVIVNEGLYRKRFINNRTSGFDAYKAFAGGDDFNPERVADVIGISADTIRRIAREFSQTQPAIAWSGLGATGWPHGSYASHAIYCLNALVGSIDAPGGVIYQELPHYKDMPALAGTAPGINYRNLADHLIQDHDFDILIGFNSNLIMSVPDSSKWNEALAKAKYYVHVGPAWNEMAAYADIILPACTYLEEWGYETALPGSGYAEAKIKQPVIGPLYRSRPTAQIVFDLAARLGAQVQDAFKNIGDNPEGFVKYRTGDFISWDAFKADGIWTGPAYVYAKDDPSKYDQLFKTPSGKFEFHTENLGHVLNIDFVGDASEFPYKLVTYRPVLDIRNGNQNYPWAQEIFLVMQGHGWNNFVEINNHTAGEIKINDGDSVLVDTAFGQIKAQARVIEGILPGVAAIASGQGHYACGEWADGIGVNPNDITSLKNDAGTLLNCDTLSGQPCFLNTMVRIRKA